MGSSTEESKNIYGILKMSSLLYNRQFIVVNREITYSDNWNKDILSNREDTWHIYYHPNLTFTRRNNDGMELILFGYLLDPENPSFGDQDILEDLLNTGSFDKLTRKISNYCGRFVLIYSDQYELRILNDPSGFRELYYCFDRDTISFGSTPNLLAKFLKIEKTKNKEIIAFFKSDEYHKADFTWVGENTLYDNILHLLPNNYLNITTKCIQRKCLGRHPINQKPTISGIFT